MRLATISTAAAVALGVTACAPGFASDAQWATLRTKMVEDQLEGSIRDERVLAAMRAVPRHELVPREQKAYAYEGRPLSIGYGQTISQPYVVAAMTEALKPEPDDVVLEVGTGSGYQAAVLARLVRHVYTIEIVGPLAERARTDLARIGADNVTVIHGDGHRGLPEKAPFDGIIVTAAPKSVPPALLEQLAPDARLVIPVGEPRGSLMVYHKKRDGQIEAEKLFDVLFVPMTGGAERTPVR